MAKATNRWGYSFTKGDEVERCSANGEWWHAGTYVRLAKASDYSRAYGRQAIVLGRQGGEHAVGIDDLRPLNRKA